MEKYLGLKNNKHKFKIRFAINGSVKTVTYEQIRGGLVAFSFSKPKVNPTKTKTKTKKIPKKKNEISSTGLKLMGLDLASSLTGYACLHGTSLVSTGMVKKTGEKFIRISKMCDEIMFRIEENDINHVIIEDIYLDKRDEKSVIGYKCLAQQQGTLVDRLIKAKIGYTLVMASQWKSHFGILKSRDAGKDCAIDLVEKMTGIRYEVDTAEAILIVIYGLNVLVK